MNFNIEYKVKDINFWDENLTLYVSVITDSEAFKLEMLSDGVDKIKLYDTNRNWFIPRDKVDIIHTSNDERINLG